MRDLVKGALLIMGATATILNAREVAAAKKSEADFLVQGLEQIEPAYGSFEGKMFSGMMPLDEAERPRAELMFWMFEPNRPTTPDSLVVWFNGGPGCSSFLGGVLFECSPVTTPHYHAGHGKTRYDEPLVFNERSWTKATNMLFVEQPTGVGFSKGPLPKDESDLSNDFYDFLVRFYDVFPRMKSKNLFLFGESYAGMYVPSMAHCIHQKNLAVGDDGDRKVPLAGIALGNGWMDAKVQGPAVIDYAWWHGMIDMATKDALYANWKACLAGNPVRPPFHEFTVPDECNVMGATLKAAGAGILDLSPNTYDVTTWDTYPVLFNLNSTIRRFFNNPKVKRALNAPEDEEWFGCLPGSGRRLEEQLPGALFLAHDRPESTVPYVAELLEHTDIRVLIYAGDRDLSTNAQGSEMILSNMHWSGASEWKLATRSMWMVYNQFSGYAKSHANLDFLIVFNSGHLVPYNMPVQGLDLVSRFVSGQSFSDIELPKILPPSTVGASGQTSKHRRNESLLGKCLVAVVFFLFGLVAASAFRRRGYANVRDVPADHEPLVDDNKSPAVSHSSILAELSSRESAKENNW